MKRIMALALVLMLAVSMMGTGFAEEDAMAALQEKIDQLQLELDALREVQETDLAEIQNEQIPPAVDLSVIPRPTRRSNPGQFLYWYCRLYREVFGEKVFPPELYIASFMDEREYRINSPTTNTQPAGKELPGYRLMLAVKMQEDGDWAISHFYLKFAADSEHNKRWLMVLLYALLDGNMMEDDVYAEWCKQHIDEDYALIEATPYATTWGGSKLLFSRAEEKGSEYITVSLGK